MKKLLVFIVFLLVCAVIGGTGYLAGIRYGGCTVRTIEIRPRVGANPPGKEKGKEKPPAIEFVGYVRGRSQTTLMNKYAGFVSKVNVYSHRRVRKGDVILEYDDLPLRTAIEKAEHNIAEHQKVLERKKLNLTLTRLDPLPSEYRNLYWKRRIAQENLERSAHEYNVYQRLHGSKIVTDLAFLEKKEAFKNSEAEVKKMDNDMKILKQGLANLYVSSAEMEVNEAEIKLKDLQEELSRLREERKYYQIVAPYDGLCITNSDTVHGYNAAGTSAAEVHRDDRKLVYAYCPERYIRFVREGIVYPFVSTQYPADRQGFELKCFEIKKNRYQYGDESYFLVKLRVMKEPHPLRIGSIGILQVSAPESPAVSPLSGENR